MNTCMMKYATQAEHDAARAEWFATIEQRRVERETKEEKRKEEGYEAGEAGCGWR